MTDERKPGPLALLHKWFAEESGCCIGCLDGVLRCECRDWAQDIITALEAAGKRIVDREPAEAMVGAIVRQYFEAEFDGTLDGEVFSRKVAHAICTALTAGKSGGVPSPPPSCGEGMMTFEQVLAALREDHSARFRHSDWLIADCIYKYITWGEAEDEPYIASQTGSRALITGTELVETKWERVDSNDLTP